MSVSPTPLARGEFEQSGAEDATSTLSELAQEARQRRCAVLVCLYLTVGRTLQSTVLRDFIDVYLFETSGHNEVVGQVESTTGFLRLLVLVPAGLLTDRLDRVFILKVAAAAKLVPVLCIVWSTREDNLALLWLGLVLLAVVDCTIDLVIQVVLVDTVVEPAARLRVLSQVEMATYATAALGPLLGLIILLSLGDVDWSRPFLRAIVCAGTLLYFVTEPASVFLRPPRTSTAQRRQPRSGSQAPPPGGAAAGRLPQAQAPPPPRPEEEPPPPSLWLEDVACCGVRKRWAVPIWSDAVWAVTQIAGSMSLRYVPLFFRRDFGLSPAAVLGVRVLENGSLAVVNSVTPGIVRHLGRGRSCFLMVLLGAAFMLGVSQSHSAALAVSLYALRTCTARAWLPPLKAIIYECVKQEQRGCWSALTSFKSATNGLGSWVGGRLADLTGDYRAGFMLTSGLHFLSALAFLPVVAWLPKEPQT